MGLSFLVLGVIPGAIDFKKLAEAGKEKRLGLEEEEVAKIKRKHYVK